jgi:hypothetical protein
MTEAFPKRAAGGDLRRIGDFPFEWRRDAGDARAARTPTAMPSSLREFTNVIHMGDVYQQHVPFIDTSSGGTIRA